VIRISIILVLTLTLLGGAARGETFKLTTGETITGEVLTSGANDQGIQVKVGEGKYERVPWSSFSQEDLKKFAQNPKLEPFVEPLIEITAEERIKKTEVQIKEPQRLERPAGHSLFAALAGSGPGLLILLLLYAANLYAAYEIALFRAQSVPMVCGVSAVLPIVGPIVFLSMATQMRTAEEPIEAPAEAPLEPGAAPGNDAIPAAAAAPDATNPMQGAAPHPAGLKLAHSEPAAAAPASTPATIYQRGQFTFNRRFFETKFPNFFGMVRKDADKNLELVIKSVRGEYAGQRISRIAANDLHLEMHVGSASQEVLIPFQEIQQIQVRQKPA
jgi:hypothetical protein